MYLAHPTVLLIEAKARRSPRAPCIAPAAARAGLHQRRCLHPQAEGCRSGFGGRTGLDWEDSTGLSAPSPPPLPPHIPPPPHTPAPPPHMGTHTAHRQPHPPLPLAPLCRSRSFYAPQQSSPVDNRYAFVFAVRIKNVGHAVVRLQASSWEVTDCWRNAQRFW